MAAGLLEEKDAIKGSGQDSIVEENASLGQAGIESQDPERASAKDNKPSIVATSLAIVALMFGTFLVALDVNILATAIPKITTEFSSLDDVAWYGAAYSLCKMAFQPSYGRLCALFPLKIVFYIANAFLALGAIVCAVAPSSEVLIFGRAIQGLGGAGIFSTVLTMCAFVVSKKTMPLFISLISTMYIVASLLGPVIGGVFTDSYLTWRFCFWINLPIGAISMILTYLFIEEPVRESTKKPLREKLGSLDPLGTIILIGSVTCLILALQWGGVTHPWSDSRVWGCLVGFGLTLILFIVYQNRLGEKALIPMRIVTQRTVASSCAVVTFLIIGINVPVYYLPFYFQASLGVSTTKSGLYVLPLAVCNPLASIAVGAAVTLTGVYVPWMMASGAIAAIGYGLLSTLNLESSLGNIIGFQIIASIGFGLGVQLPFTAMRNVLSETDIPIANALLVFFQGLGTSLSLSVGQTLFLNTLKDELRSQISATEANYIVDLGAGNIDESHVRKEELPIIANAYSTATRTAMYLAIASAVAAFVCSLAVEWKTMDRSDKKNDEPSEQIESSDKVENSDSKQAPRK